MSPLDLLQRRFGFDTFRPGQERVIAHLLDGCSAAAVFPTGAGKSLCYQLPALAFDGLTLVVSPLIALMKDQIDQLHERGIAARRLDSSLSWDEVRDTMAAVRDGSLKLLYVAPERFNNERFREAMAPIPIALFAIDEAHCISEWGHNFRPDYLKLPEYARSFGAERVLALTATATPQVLTDICSGFDIEPEHAVRTGFYRPNLELLMTPSTAGERDAALLDRLVSRPPGPTIVYVTLQKTAATVAGNLAAAGFDAMAYHAGMPTDQRTRVQEAFLGSSRAVVVATIAFGMGIDKSDIRYVYHYNLPKSLESYSQEIGRAGRDGEPSICEMLIVERDLNVLQNFAYGDTPSLTAVQTLVEEIFAGGDDLELALVSLGNRHDIRALVLRTLLTYLELDGYLRSGTPLYSRYRFQALCSSREILERFQGQRREFLRAVFRQAVRKRTWLELDLDQASRRLGAPRDRLVRALDYLAERQLLELKASGVLHRYRVLRRPDDPAALADELHARMLDRETREVERLEQVLEMVTLDGCQVSHLGAHFGEPLAQPCGHCTWCCNGSHATELPRSSPTPIDDRLWADATRLRADHEALAEPRSFARFLTGLTSPALSRAKLTTKQPLFGCLAEVPFDEVLERARAGSG